MRRAASIISLALLIAACGVTPSVPSPTGTADGTPASAEASGTPSSADPSASAVATARPGLDTVPRFATGSVVATNAPGLRVRSRPGTGQRVITTLGVDAELLVGMGPIVVDELGWYLVRDADDAEPAFSEGWVAAGFEPDPFLISAGFAPDENPFLGGFADTTSGEFGPVPIPERGATVRWIAATHQAEVCNFSLDLSSGSGEPVRAVRTPVGAFPASGELPAQFFASNQALGDAVFAIVESDCSWAVSFVRVPPAASPSPS